MRITIIGSGLLGTSLGLALSQRGHQIAMADRDPDRAALAADLVQGTSGLLPAEVVVVATPVSAISEVVRDAFQQDLGQIVTDLGSIKSKPQSEVKTYLAPNDYSRFVPGHPMAGRERSGPEAARSDLFLGRPWILTPDHQTSPDAVGAIEALVAEVGANPVRMEAAAHDQAVAAISHLPQLVASLVAGLVGQQPESALALAGQGLRDLTRIAGSDPQLWGQILAANASSIAPLVRSLIADLDRVVQSLDQYDEKSIYEVIEKGRTGRKKLPGKHGGLSTNYAVIPIVIDDRPGQLGALFEAAGRFQINVEDLAMEHSPGQETGLVELSVDPARAGRFVDFLTKEGWRVHPVRYQGDSVVEL